VEGSLVSPKRRELLHLAFAWHTKGVEERLHAIVQITAVANQLTGRLLSQ
jgi:hypothetical protein